MSIKEELLKAHSKAHTMRIVRMVGEDKKLFRELVDTFLEGEYRVTQRAAWPLCYCGLEHPELLKPYMRKLLDRLKEPGIHDAVKRNVVRIWAEVPIPGELSGEIYDLCFGYLRALEEPLAVKAFSITVLQKICKPYPELADELRITLEDMQEFAAPSTASRIRRALKELNSRA